MSPSSLNPLPPKLSEWLVPIGNHYPHAQLSLFCFPPAGSGANFFRSWPTLFPNTINLWAIRLPGRESRLRQPFPTCWDTLLETLMDAIAPHYQLPFSFFGHSFGALVSFELACQLRHRSHPIPNTLVVSARNAPHISTNVRDYQRTDAALIAELRSDGGTPDVILQNSELMELILPIYRADLYLNQNYCYTPRNPLPCPIVAFGGKSDQTVPNQSLAEWEQHTQHPFHLQLFPGPHMYLTQSQGQKAVVRSLIKFIQPHTF